MTDDTLRTPPPMKRPETGFLAWQATIGYISVEHSPDALLALDAYPMDSGDVGWKAAASWGRFSEEVQDMPSLAEALRTLWRVVDRHHTIFKSVEAAARRPVNYGDEEWLDVDSSDILNKLIQLTYRAFGSDWRIVIVYQPVENPGTRVQARIIARNEVANSGGRGATLREACQLLYRNAANEFK